MHSWVSEEIEFIKDTSETNSYQTMSTRTLPILVYTFYFYLIWQKQFQAEKPQVMETCIPHTTEYLLNS